MNNKIIEIIHKKKLYALIVKKKINLLKKV